MLSRTEVSTQLAARELRVGFLSSSGEHVTQSLSSWKEKEALGVGVEVLVIPSQTKDAVVLVFSVFNSFHAILFICFLAMPRGMWDLSSLSRNRTNTTCIGNVGS